MKKLYVGNFNFNMTEGELRSIFEQFGAVTSVSLAIERGTGRVRGFGVVEMTDDAEADKAIAVLNGTDVGGRSLNVHEAHPESKRSKLRGSGRDRYSGHGRCG
jgi:RNA recognition motif-containing protein